jgi:exodeoxyribonuclease-3
VAKIISYNVNGMRAAVKKGLLEWLKATNPDVLCLQEIKGRKEQFDTQIFEEMGYHHYWCSAAKKGYSGVAILSKQKPDFVEYGLGVDTYDIEGRVLRADFGATTILSIYVPAGSTAERQEFKMGWLSNFETYINRLKQSRPNIIISGDFNICHQAIDLHNPVGNQNSSGFLTSERNWVSRLLANDFVDAFRVFNREPHQYTWWSNRQNSRTKNLGWRIDYQLISASLTNGLNRATILKQAQHSDHCPVMLDITFP